jgi:hypothetical protein
MKLMKVLKRLRSEDGFAVPTATLMLIAATGIVTVGVMASVRTQSGATRDADTKSALPQAEAGINQALLHFNRIEPNTNPCSPVTPSAPDPSGWCAAVSGGFDGGTFTYQVRPESTTAVCGSIATECLEIIAAGQYDGVTRRVHATAHSSSGQNVFFEATVQSQDSIQMDSNSEVHAGTATNGDITLNSNAKQCGQASVGVGKHLNQGPNAGYFTDPSCTQPASDVLEEPLNLPPVNQGDAATVNDNSRFFALDPISGNQNNACWNGLKGNGNPGICGSRHLDISSNTSVTLGGGVYSFCKLTMSSNTALYVQAGASVVIYFDSPENCDYDSGETQMELASNARITATGGGPANAALLFVGSPTRQTNILLNSNTSIAGSCSQNFVIYAPRTDITINSNATYCGAVAGKTLHLDSNARIYTDDSASNFVLPNTAAHYALDRFVECASSATGQPEAGC